MSEGQQSVWATGALQHSACVSPSVLWCNSVDLKSGLKWQNFGHAEQSGAPVVIVTGRVETHAAHHLVAISAKVVRWNGQPSRQVP